MSQPTYINGLIHQEGTLGADVILLPVTQYENILCAPTVVSDLANANGAPFVIKNEGTIEVPDDLFPTI